jgi:hypothetical protein
VLGRYATAGTPAAAPAPPAQATAPVRATAPVQAAPPAVAAVPGSTAVARPVTQAAVAVEARTTVAPAMQQPLAVPDAGHPGPPSGTVYESSRPPKRSGQRGLSGRLARLRIGSHTASPAALSQLRISSANSGLILGADRQQRPVSVRLFRSEPTRITLVGGTWAGQLVAFRALALGARVAVVTAQPYVWQDFGARAVGQGDQFAVLSADQPLAVTATAQEPVLIVNDLGSVGATGPQSLGPWHAELTVLRQLDQSTVSAVQNCDVVMLQRLRGPEAALAGAALRLPASGVQFLQVMAEDMVALVGDGTERYIWFTATEVERQYAGPPRR